MYWPGAMPPQAYCCALAGTVRLSLPLLISKPVSSPDWSVHVNWTDEGSRARAESPVGGFSARLPGAGRGAAVLVVGDAVLEFVGELGAVLVAVSGDAVDGPGAPVDSGALDDGARPVPRLLYRTPPDALPVT